MEELFALPGGDACAANQVLYNLKRRRIEYDLVPWCRARKIPIMAYSPIEQAPAAECRRAQSHRRTASGATPAQVALALAAAAARHNRHPKGDQPAACARRTARRSTCN